MRDNDNIVSIVEQKLEWIQNNIWYVFLLLSSTGYVLYNCCLINIKEMNIPTVVFILWIALLFYPLIAEFEFLGLKVKREVKKATAEQERKIQSIQQELHEIRVDTSINNQINFGLDKLLPLEVLNQLSTNLIKGKQEGENEIIEPKKYVDDNNTYLVTQTSHIRNKPSIRRSIRA